MSHPEVGELPQSHLRVSEYPVPGGDAGLPVPGSDVRLCSDSVVMPLSSKLNRLTAHKVGASLQLPALNNAQLFSPACPPFEELFQVPGHLKKNVTMVQKQSTMTCLDENCNCNVFWVSILFSHLMDKIRFTFLCHCGQESGYHYGGPWSSHDHFNHLSLSLYFSLKRIKHQ